MKFIKMHGLSNDFVIVDLRKGGALPALDHVATLTNRKTGIGCDQFIPIYPPKSDGTDCFMRILNAPDASEVEACGNATRCVADILMRESGKDRCVIETVAGLLHASREAGGRITVDMGIPRLKWDEIPMSQEMDTLEIDLGINGLPMGVGVNIGNPHCVFFMDRDVEQLDLEALGPSVEHHSLFPQRTNTEFCNILDKTTIRMRVWERDSGETQACGSGACATAVAAIRRGLVDRKCSVILNGGTLDFHWRENDGHILMTGEVASVFKGELL